MRVNNMKRSPHDIGVDDNFDFDNSLSYMKTEMTKRAKQDYVHNVSDIRKESVFALGAIACIVFLEGVVYAVASFLWM